VRVGRVGIVNPDLTFNKITDTGAFALRAKLMSGVTLNSGYASFDASYFSVVDLWSYALAANFNGKEATLITRARIPAAEIGSSTARRISAIGAGTQDWLRITKSAANTVTLATDTTTQAAVSATHTPAADTWYTYGITVSRSAGQFKGYVDGSQTG